MVSSAAGVPITCPHCGAQLARGAIGCFRCGRLVEADDGKSAVAAAPTSLGTVAQAQLLENQWRLVKLIGRGGVAEVWQAHDTQLDRPVALKWMHESLLADPQQLSRFQREARVLAGVEHPNLLSVLGIGTAHLRPFLVTALLEGKTLAELMHQQGGRLSASDTARVLSPICDALEALHRSNIVHRDLKPSNVFIGTDGRVTLMDLGSALEGGSELTRAGEQLGAVGYLSPEQLAGKRDLDGKSDIYALGCLLFEVLSGKPPFEGEPPQVIAAHQSATRPMAEGAPEALAELMRSAMALAPAHRPTAQEFKAKLAPFLPLGAAPPLVANVSGRTAASLPPIADDAPSVPVAPLPVEPTRPAPVQAAPSQTMVDDDDEEAAPTKARPALVQQVRLLATPPPPPAKSDPRWAYGLAGVVLLALVITAIEMRKAPDLPGPVTPLIPGTAVLKAPALPPKADEAPNATQDLKERRDEIWKRSDSAHEARVSPGSRPLPTLRKKTAAYFGAGQLGELQIVVKLDGEEVTAELAIDGKPQGASPIYLPLAPRTYRVKVERHMMPVSEFPVVVEAKKSTRLEVELKPLQ
jgi:eukaryotic-like serine/threonine-protein kinase